ncbi:MAG: hypothetical protein J6C27_00820 [Clostridia bacterium]|nr:hypothetical protein [Clostridia bacterium]
MSKKSKKLKLYHVKKSTMLMTGITAFLCVVILVLIGTNSHIINSVSNDGITVNEKMLIHICKIVADILIVIVSILGTNLLLSVLVEKNSKNNIVTEFLVNDMLSSESVYANLSDENQTALLKNIELRRVFDGNETAYEMHNYMNEKVKNNLKEYYYSECEYVVVADVKDEYFEKTVTHTIVIVPYEKEKVLKKFPLTTINIKNINGLLNYELKDVQINGRPLKIVRDNNGEFASNSEVQWEKVANKNKLDNKNGYNLKIKYYLKNRLMVSQNNPVKIVSNYITRCPIDDITTTFRASVPCKKFIVNYTVEPEEQYKLTGSAFGFLDAASAYQNSHKTNVMRFGFDNWIFTDDGVSIVMNKK